MKKAYSEEVSYDFVKIDDVYRHLAPAMNDYQAVSYTHLSRLLMSVLIACEINTSLRILVSYSSNFAKVSFFDCLLYTSGTLHRTSEGSVYHP